MYLDFFVVFCGVLFVGMICAQAILFRNFRYSIIGCVIPKVPNFASQKNLEKGSAPKSKQRTLARPFSFG